MKKTTEYDQVRRYQLENTRLRRQLREVTDTQIGLDGFLNGMEQFILRCNKIKYPKPVIPKRTKGVRCTAEILFSDLQIGKLTSDYNSSVARARVDGYVKAVLGEIENKRKAGHVVERIVLAFLGDIIESDKKHANSARATDSGTATQIADAMEALFIQVVLQLAALSIPMDVICVTGNHDHDGHGLAMFRPGKEHLSWPLYKGLQMLSEASGLKHVTFNIPEGAFTTVEFYGQHCLYEHGVGVSVSESSMASLKNKRSEQLNVPLTYFRMGDKHNVSSFNGNQYVVNGAFFGSGRAGVDYSEIVGFSSAPAQWMGWHCARGDSRFTIWDSFVIQLSHIN